MPQPIRSIIALVVLAIILCFPASGHPKCCSCDPEDGLNVPTTPGVVNYKPNHCAPVITGPDEAWRPDATHPAPQYANFQASSPCCGQGFTWTITGTDVSIDASTGVVTVSANACGSFTVTATDACGYSAGKGARVANAGHWSIIDRENDCGWSIWPCDICGPGLVYDAGSTKLECGGCEKFHRDQLEGCTSFCYLCWRFFSPVPTGDPNWYCAFEGCALYQWVGCWWGHIPWSH